MPNFRYIPQRDVDARHAKARATRLKVERAREASTLPLRNVEPILSLGELEFIHFRGRAYGVPPLPWKRGQEMLSVHAATVAAGALVSERGDKKAFTDYYRGLDRLQKIMWAHMRPVGIFRRFLRRLGMLRNPFHEATEREILEHADFFCSRRMRSGVRPSLANRTQGRTAPPMSSTSG